MSNIFSVFQSSSTDSTCRQKKRLEPLLHVKYFQFSIVAVQIQPAGKKTVGTCLLHVKYFQFSTATVQIQPGGKKNGWNLFVACQISSVFHSSCTDSTCWQKNGWNLFVACQIFSVFHSSCTDLMCRQKKLLEPVCCMSNIFSFPQQLYRFNLGAKKRLEPLLHVKYFQFSIVAVQIQLAGKTVGTCLLHVKYFQFSTVAIQIQLTGKKNCWNLFVACQIFSVFHSSCTDSTCRQKKLLEPVCCMSNIFNFPKQLYRFNLQAKKLLEPVCCMSNIFSFPQQLYRFNLGAKKRLEPVLHVKYFQFSIVAVQIQPAGKKTVGTCLLHVKYFSVLLSWMGTAWVAGHAFSSTNWKVKHL